MMVLRELDILMESMGVWMEARWMPHVVNRYADALSHLGARGFASEQRSCALGAAAVQPGPRGLCAVPFWRESGSEAQINLGSDGGEMRR